MKSSLNLFLLFICSISVSFADGTGYEVELIVFEDVNARYLQSEDWSYNDMLRNKIADDEIKDAELEHEDIKNNLIPDPEYKQLLWDDAKLSNQLERLLNNNNYRVLASRRWKQTGLDRLHAFNISINDKAETIQETSTEEPLKNTLDTNQENTISPPVTTQAYLTGNVKLIMSRYLHFNVNLQYVKPFENENAELDEKTFPVINERRMRSREIHYIDHPLIGIIVLATPYTIPDKEAQTEEKKSLSTEYKTM